MSTINTKRRLGVGLREIEAYLHRPLRAGESLAIYDVAYGRITIWRTDPRGVVEKRPLAAAYKRRKPFIIRPSCIAIKIMPDGTAVFGVDNIPEFVTGEK